MSERKVLNKYYPPDFDPSKIPKSKLPKNRQWNIRIMAPFNMRCGTCGEYIYKGKKFNSRKEDVEDDDYLGLKIFRFYIKCPRCVAEISFKTDPENTDYTLEDGAVRNFEALRTAELMAQRELKEKEEEEKNNPMKVLENRTKASRQEMDMLETLEDLRELNSRHAKVDHETMLQVHAEYEKQLARLQDEEDEALIKSIFGKASEGTIKRIHQDEADEDDNQAGSSAAKKPRPTNASDLLTEDSTDDDRGETSRSKIPSASTKPAAKPALWQNSVGGIKQNSLKGLVKIKSSSATGSNGGKTARASTTTPTTSTAVNNKQISSEEKNDNSDQGQAGAVHKGEVSNTKTEGNEVKKSASATTAGLSLLGAYSDSDDTSDASG